MKIEHSQVGNKVIIKIYEHVTSIADVHNIKTHIHDGTFDEIEIVLYDAFVIPSALIGLLLKIVKGDKKIVNIKATNELIELLKELNLQNIFKLTTLG